MAVIKVQTPTPEVIKSNKTILKNPKINVINPPYIFPKGIIIVIIGSTFGALNGINLIAKADKNMIIYLTQFFI